jgi:hypothetical protein
MKVFSSPSASSSLFLLNLNLMSKVKTITLNGKVSEYDVIYTKAYVAKIISVQSDLYQELNPSSLPYNAVKEIYVDGILEAELVGSSLLYVTGKRRDITTHDPYVDRHKPQTPPTAGMGRYKGHTVPEEFDESHALDMVLNDMVENMTDEEIREMYLDETTEETTNKSIYLQSVTSPPPYWVTDTTAGDVEINYTS